MDYNERNGSYSDDELLSRFSRPETPRTTVQDDIPDDPAALRRDRGPRPGIRMASGRPMRGMKMQRPTGRKGSPNYRAALCGAVLAFFVIALLFFVLFMSRGGKIKELNSQIDTLDQDKQSLSAQITSLQQQVDTLTASMTSALPDATVADTNTIAELIPQLADGSTYVVQSSASQLRYIKATRRSARIMCCSPTASSALLRATSASSAWTEPRPVARPPRRTASTISSHRSLSKQQRQLLRIGFPTRRLPVF